MSTIDIAQYLYDLESRGASFAEDAGELQATAPEGVLDSEAIGFLRDHRGKVLALIRDRATSIEERRLETYGRLERAQAKARSDGQVYHWNLEELGEPGSARYEEATRCEAEFESACAAYVQTGEGASEMQAAWLTFLASIKD